MKKQQGGFTLIELAIVLVIIGLLLGGVLKGQELINSAKVKNYANDFRNIPVFLYGYQDKFKALPGDDSASITHLNLAAGSDKGNGNGIIDGQWKGTATSDETLLFWRDVRLAGLAPGSTTVATSGFLPTNSDGGQIGIQSNSETSPVIKNATGGSNIKGTYVICSEGILGKFVIQLDTLMDDGVTNTGSMQAVDNTAGSNTVTGLTAKDSTNGGIDPATAYTVCMGV